MTSGEKQARYRQRYRSMRESLAAILEASTLKQAKVIAAQALGRESKEEERQP